jgi:8-oxo-dGTP diphosphatase
MTSTPRATVVVVAAVLVECGRVLVTKRPEGSHLAGMWEFPGGKVEPDEDPRAALQRELREELGIESTVGDVLEVTFHRYPNKTILLLFFHTSLQATSPPPRTLDVAAFAWRSADELIDDDFPPADVTILQRVRASLRQPA